MLLLYNYLIVPIVVAICNMAQRLRRFVFSLHTPLSYSVHSHLKTFGSHAQRH